MMEYLRTTRYILFFATAALFWGGFCFNTPSAHADVTYINNIVYTTSTTWSSTSTYVVSSSLTIASGTTLTITSGTIVKFVQDGKITVNLNAVLNVLGDPANLVYFTATKDSTVGSSTPGYSTSTANPGDGGILILASGSSSTFNNAIVEYGGHYATFSYFADIYQGGGTLNLNYTTIASSSKYGLHIASPTTTIANSTFANNQYGIYAETGATATISNSTITNNQYGINFAGVTRPTVTITGSTISNNSQYGINAGNPGNLTLTSSTFFTNGSSSASPNGDVYINFDNATMSFTHWGNTDTATTTPTGRRAFVLASSALGTSTTLTSDGIPYYIYNGFDVASGTTLTVNHGVIAKFAQDKLLQIDPHATLNVLGTSTDPVYLTAITDDSVGGDTNGDGASSAARGDGGIITLAANSSSSFTNAFIEYGGHSTTYKSDIYQTGGNSTLTNVVIASSSQYGLNISGGMSTILYSEILNNTIDGIHMTSGTVTVASSSFINNSTYGFEHTGSPTSTAVAENNWWNASSGPTFAGNPGGSGDKISNYVDYSPYATSTQPYWLLPTILSGTITTSTTWSLAKSPYVVTSTVTINSGVRVDIDPNVVIKFKPSTDLVVNGTLSVNGNSSSLVYFTSYKDDSVGGDTNGDGTSTSPSAGDWGTIVIGLNASATINGSVVRYGGVDPAYTANIYNSGALVMQYDDISYSSQDGVCAATGTTTGTLMSIHDNYNGMKVASGTFSLATSTIYHNSVYGAYQTDSPTSTMGNNYWGGWMPLDLSSSTTFNSGPFVASNPSGAGDVVTSYIGYDPYITAYISSPYNPYWSPPGVNTKNWPYIMRIGSSTRYQAQLDSAINIWNSSSSGYVTMYDYSATSSAYWDTYVLDIDSSSSDTQWPGIWRPSTTSTPFTILNKWGMEIGPSNATSVIIHELGHALGLSHSVSGNVMCNTCGTLQQTTLGPQDLKDFNFLWSPDYFFDPHKVKGRIKW